MPGPLPKNSENRVRRNRPQVTATELPRESGRDAPDLPGEADAWPEAVRAWWLVLWASPMASQYIDADVEPLMRLALLKREVYCGEITATVLAEVRNIEDRYGLSPIARRRLEWRLPSAAVKSAADGPATNTRLANVRRLKAVAAG